MELTDEEWRAKLSPERYAVLRQKGTEPAWSGELLHVEGSGMFTCAGCGAALFPSDTKFESGSGWPSFYRALDDGVIDEHVDRTFGMTPDRDHLCPVRRPPRPRVPRRAGPDRPALLRELAVHRVRARRRTDPPADPDPLAGSDPGSAPGRWRLGARSPIGGDQALLEQAANEVAEGVGLAQTAPVRDQAAVRRRPAPGRPENDLVLAQAAPDAVKRDGVNPLPPLQSSASVLSVGEHRDPASSPRGRRARPCARRRWRTGELAPTSSATISTLKRGRRPRSPSCAARGGR